MKNLFSRVLLCLILTVSFVGFTTYAVAADDIKAKYASGQYIPKVDNFEVIIDASASMAETYKGAVKLEIAKNFISRMNQALPDLKVSAALRKFGFVGVFSDKKTELLYGLTSYTKQPLEDALQTVRWAGGDSPMAIGISEATNDLKATTGKIAVIIVSDWDELGNAPVQAAEEMKRQLGARVCIYPVMVGDDAGGKKLMEKVAQAGQCGFVSYNDKMVSAQDMSDFVENVFFTTGKRPPEVVSITLKLEFDTGKSDIKARYHNEIKKVADFMKKYPDTKTAIEGHTDNVGNEEKNVKLSQSRADSVRTYLIEKFGIEKERLQAVGYGPKKPLTSNATAEGRQKNRRVEAVIKKSVQK